MLKLIEQGRGRKHRARGKWARILASDRVDRPPKGRKVRKTQEVSELNPSDGFWGAGVTVLPLQVGSNKTATGQKQMSDYSGTMAMLKSLAKSF